MCKHNLTLISLQSNWRRTQDDVFDVTRDLDFYLFFQRKITKNKFLR